MVAHSANNLPLRSSFIDIQYSKLCEEELHYVSYDDRLSYGMSKYHAVGTMN